MMKYQVVLQVPESSVKDFDEMISIEDTLIEQLAESHIVDGHDCGCSEINFFILTNNYKDVFEKTKILFEKLDLLEYLKIAYRSLDSDEYTVMWPAGLNSFKVM